jgi:hypothetical protein
MRLSTEGVYFSLYIRFELRYLRSSDSLYVRLIQAKKQLIIGIRQGQKDFNVIRRRNEPEKKGRPFGDRPVELDFSFVCNKVRPPGGAM